MRVVQLSHRDHGRRVAVVDEPHLRLLRDRSSIYELAQVSIETNRSLCALIECLTSDEYLNYDDVHGGRSEWRLLPPIDHPEPSRCFVTGTGLTHQGSAE